jgi:hypothetical protein
MHPLPSMRADPTIEISVLIECRHDGRLMFAMRIKS